MLDDEEDIQHQWGRVLGCLIDTYNDPKSILSTGMNIEPEDTARLEKEYVPFLFHF
jgi:hypothetical protein